MPQRQPSKKLITVLSTGSIIAFAVFLCFWGRAMSDRKCAIDYASRLLVAHECFEIQYKKLLYGRRQQGNNRRLILGDDRCEEMLLTGKAQERSAKEIMDKTQETDKIQEEELKQSAAMVQQFIKEWSHEPVEQAQSHTNIVTEGIRIAFAKGLLPFAIDYDANRIFDYPGIFIDQNTAPDCPPDSACSVPFGPDQQDPQPPDEQAEIITRSKSVGRIALVADDTHKYPPPQSPFPAATPGPASKQLSAGQMQQCVTSPQGYAPPGTCVPYFWGTAFVIANGVIATSCHELDPLVKNKNGTLTLTLDPDVKLIVDFGDKTFGDKTDAYPDRWDIDLDFFECGRREGLDIALLKLLPNYDINGKPYFPQPLPLYDADSAKRDFADTGDTTKHPRLALIGYGDLQHFADSVTERLYRIFSEQKVIDKDGTPDTPPYYLHDKYALLDWVLPAPDCARYLERVLHVASTTVGFSGSVLIGIEPGRPDYRKVIAMHTCCSKYFHDPQGKPPVSDLPCANVTRTFDNQALGIGTILQDTYLHTELTGLDPDFPHTSYYFAQISSFAFVSDTKDSQQCAVPWDQVDAGKFLHIHVLADLPDTTTVRGKYRKLTDSGTGNPGDDVDLGAATSVDGYFDFVIKPHTLDPDSRYRIKVASDSCYYASCKSTGIIKTK